MTFIIQNVHETDVLSLEFSDLGISESRLPTKANCPNWKCAVQTSDITNIVFFTQLVSSSGEMREGRYYYLLVVNNDPILVEWDAGKASVYDKGNAKSYSMEYLTSIINEAAVVLNHDNKPFNWKQNNEIPNSGYLKNA